MKYLGEKMLLITAGAAVGVAGFIAWENRDKIKSFIESTIVKSKDTIEGLTAGKADNNPAKPD